MYETEWEYSFVPLVYVDRSVFYHCPIMDILVVYRKRSCTFNIMSYLNHAVETIKHLYTNYAFTHLFMKSEL